MTRRIVRPTIPCMAESLHIASMTNAVVALAFVAILFVCDNRAHAKGWGSSSGGGSSSSSSSSSQGSHSPPRYVPPSPAPRQHTPAPSRQRDPPAVQQAPQPNHGLPNILGRPSPSGGSSSSTPGNSPGLSGRLRESIEHGRQGVAKAWESGRDERQALSNNVRERAAAAQERSAVAAGRAKEAILDSKEKAVDYVAHRYGPQVKETTARIIDKSRSRDMQSGQVLRVLSTDPGSVKDFQAFCKQTGNEG